MSSRGPTIRYSPAAREAIDGADSGMRPSRLFGHPADSSSWLVLTPNQVDWVFARPDELAALAAWRLDPERATGEASS